jgi:hypothetical protein
MFSCLLYIWFHRIHQRCPFPIPHPSYPRPCPMKPVHALSLLFPRECGGLTSRRGPGSANLAGRRQVVRVVKTLRLFKLFRLIKALKVFRCETTHAHAHTLAQTRTCAHTHWRTRTRGHKQTRTRVHTQRCTHVHKKAHALALARPSTHAYACRIRPRISDPALSNVVTCPAKQFFSPPFILRLNSWSRDVMLTRLGWVRFTAFAK